MLRTKVVDLGKHGSNSARSVVRPGFKALARAAPYGVSQNNDTADVVLKWNLGVEF